MKLTAKSFAKYVEKPSTPYLLLYGEDGGAISARLRLIAERHGEPSRIDAKDVLSDAAIVSAKLGAGGLFATSRFVRIDDADKLGPACDELEANLPKSGLAVLVAGVLEAKSTVRKWAEKARCVSSLRCDYPEVDTVLEELLTALPSLEKSDAEALSRRLPRDTGARAGEIAKLALFFEAGGDARDALAVVSLEDPFDIDAVLDPLFAGRLGQAMEAWHRFAAADESFMLVLRSLSWRLLRLRQLRASMDLGASFEEASSKLKPPVFFAQRRDMRVLSSRIPLAAMDRFIDLLATTEARCKSTGMPVEALVSAALFQIAIGLRNAQGSPR